MNEKVERLNVALLERDKIALRNLAHREGEAMAVVVRRLIREAVANPSKTATVPQGASNGQQ
jgi:hypothetical protein